MNFVYVVTGRYSDDSAFYLFGVYAQYEAAQDRITLATEAGAAVEVKAFRLPVDKFYKVDVRSDKGIGTANDTEAEHGS